MSTIVSTYVFMDLETSSLPEEDNNKSRITELSFVAVRRPHLLDTRPGMTPRIQQKLTMCFNPLRLIAFDATKVTGLSNELLEFEKPFDKEVCEAINLFLNLLPKPVCLIAHNGNNFDFPILKNHFVAVKSSLNEDVLCADSLFALYHILEKRNNKDIANILSNNTLLVSKVIEAEVQKLDNCDLKPVHVIDNTNLSNKVQATNLEATTSINEIFDNLVSQEMNEMDFFTSISFDEIQKKNEMTPKKIKKSTQPATPRKIKNNSCNSVKKSRKRFPWSIENRPPQGYYKLGNIYERVLNKNPLDAHRAEVDCLLLLEIAVCLNKEFVSWIDENCIKFKDVYPMVFGVPLGDPHNF